MESGHLRKVEIIVIKHVAPGASVRSILEFILDKGSLVIPICNYFEFEGETITKIRPYFDPRPLMPE